MPRPVIRGPVSTPARAGVSRPVSAPPPRACAPVPAVALALALAAGGAAALRGADLVDVRPLTESILVVHVDDGYVVHHMGGETKDDAVVVTDPMSTAAAVPGTFTVSSADDPAYAGGRAPASVGRKSKATEFAWYCDTWSGSPPRCVNTRPDHTKEHWLYLALPEALEAGRTYTVAWSAALDVAPASATFTWDPAGIRSDAVHVNHVGYAAGSPAKYGYLYHWMGDRGGADLAAWAGRSFRLVDDATGTTAFTGTVAFRKAATNAETGQNNQTPNRNFLGAAVWECDFTAFTTPGVYRLVVDGIGSSLPFPLAEDAYRAAFRAAMRGIYHQRSGLELLPAFTASPRPAPHHPQLTPGFAQRLRYTTARSIDYGEEGNYKAAFEAGEKGALTQTWGWYQDAGDWDGYFSHFDVPYGLLALWEAKPDNFTDGELGLPESGNGLPDLLDEAAWLPRFFHRQRTEVLAKGWGVGGVGSRVTPDEWGSGEGPGGTLRGSWQDVDRPWYVSGEDPFSTYAYAACAGRLAWALQQLGVDDPQGVDWAAEAVAAYAAGAAVTKSGDENKSMKGARLRHHRAHAALALYRLTGEAAYRGAAEADLGDLTSGSDIPDATRWPVVLALSLPADRPIDAALAGRLAAALRNGAEELTTDSADARALRWGGNWWQPLLIGQSTTPLIIEAVLAEKPLAAAQPALAADIRRIAHTTADYFLGANPLHLSWVTGTGARSPRGLFNLDFWASGRDLPPEGLVPYGVHYVDSEVAEGVWEYGWGFDKVYPNATTWPGHELWFEQRYGVLNCEYTVHQTQLPSAVVYGYLTVAGAGPGRVATPAIDVSGTDVDVGRTVTLTVADAGASILYTVDGSDPLAGGGLAYVAPFAVAAPVTIRAAAREDGREDSAVALRTLPLLAAAPEIAPDGGNVSTADAIVLTSATAGAVIRYTLDGSDPGPTSPLYAPPLHLPTTGTVVLRAQATAVGRDPSAVATATFTVSSPTVANPVFDPPGGVYEAPQAVAITTATAGAVIRYTLDGSDPGDAAPVYAAPVAVGASATLRARATREFFLPSATVQAQYIIDLPAAATPVVSPAGGAHAAPLAVTLTSGTPGAVIRYTLDGSEPGEGSALYGGTLTLLASATLKARAWAAGYDPSAVATAAFTLSTPTAATPTADPPSGTASTTPLAVVLATATPGATIRYTLDGSLPGEASPAYAVPLVLTAATTVKARAFAAGYTASGTATFIYTVNLPGAATPTASPAPGIKTSAFDLTLATATPGAAIHYTLDGSAPTTASAVYGGPILIERTTTVKALAAREGYRNSAVASFGYTLTLPAAAAVAFDPPAGVLEGPRAIGLSTATPGATIRYTLDGTTPTSRHGEVYGGPFGIVGSVTVRAVATGAGLAAGPVGAAAYTVPAGTSWLVNIATRAAVATGDNILIAGFVVTGDPGAPKPVLVRAVGPTLGGFGVPGTLADPLLRVFDAGAMEIGVNDDWGLGPDPDGVAAMAAEVGAFPLDGGSKDAALRLDLAPGAYTAQVSGLGAAPEGVALVEVYDGNGATATPRKLVNISSRARVGAAEAEVLIPGFVVTDPAGPAGRRTFLVRAVGPTLAGFGVPETLADPVVRVFDAGAAVIAANDDWGDDPVVAAAGVRVGAFPLAAGSRDAALVLSLAPGLYTVQVSGQGSAPTGVAIVEVYEVP